MPQDGVAEGIAAAGLALLHPSAQAPVGLGCEFLEEQRVHRALKADMHLVHLTVGQCQEVHARKGQVLVDSRDVGLVARDAVEGFGQHEIESMIAAVLQKPLKTGSEDHARPRQAGILIGADDLPALAQGAFATQPDLVLDGGGVLQVGGVASVEGHAEGHGEISSSQGAGMSVGVLSLFHKVIGAGGIARQGPDQGKQVIPRLRYLMIPGKGRVGGVGQSGRNTGARRYRRGSRRLRGASSLAIYLRSRAIGRVAPCAGGPGPSTFADDDPHCGRSRRCSDDHKAWERLSKLETRTSGFMNVDNLPKIRTSHSS